MTFASVSKSFLIGGFYFIKILISDLFMDMVLNFKCQHLILRINLQLVEIKKKNINRNISAENIAPLKIEW